MTICFCVVLLDVTVMTLTVKVRLFCYPVDPLRRGLVVLVFHIFLV